MLNYLAYGSNLLPERLYARLGILEVVTTIALPGWRLSYHKRGGDGSGKCNLIEDENATAFGAIYAMSNELKETLDHIEGVGSGYRSEIWQLPKIGEVAVYLAEQSHIDASLVPFDWYLEFVARGAEFHTFPPSYIASIRTVPTIVDPDAVRRQQNFDIIPKG